ncbi:hypothetical protein DFH29DRAFT_960752 [Suillus ampliporus]|nr:hypothetical protein DFH29DRAFT_960752 [Suillus ampliporus]
MTSMSSSSSRVFERVAVEKAEEHIFGVVPLNYWNARGIQNPETLPFRAFNARNFVSTWVITLDVLEPFKIAYDMRRVSFDLLDKDDVTDDISVSMEVIPGGQGQRDMGRSSLRNSYWMFQQMFAFHMLSEV